MSNEYRKIILENINNLEKQNVNHGTKYILSEVATQLKILGNREEEQILISTFNELFLQGIISWGLDLSNLDSRWYHLTRRGKEALKDLSHDPANPQGYFNLLNTIGYPSPIAESYIKEAISTYNANCFKASAVMVGAAAESLSLELGNIIMKKIDSEPEKYSKIIKQLHNWQINQIISGISSFFELNESQMTKDLKDNYKSYWQAFVQQIRLVRNEAGHPCNVDPITHEAIHASLLIFPLLMKLVKNLIEWIDKDFKN